MRTVRTACLANSRHSLSSLRHNYSQGTIPSSNIEEHMIFVETRGLVLQHRWILRTVSSASSRTMTRLQNIIYVIFPSCDLMRKKQTYLNKQGDMASKQQPVPRFIKAEVSSTEARDSAVTSVTSAVIRDNDKYRVLHWNQCCTQGMLARPLGHTGLCGIAQVWVDEIFEKMDQVELTGRYVK